MQGWGRTQPPSPQSPRAVFGTVAPLSPTSPPNVPGHPGSPSRTPSGDAPWFHRLCIGIPLEGSSFSRKCAHLDLLMMGLSPRGCMHTRSAWGKFQSVGFERCPPKPQTQPLGNDSSVSFAGKGGGAGLRSSSLSPVQLSPPAAGRDGSGSGGLEQRHLPRLPGNLPTGPPGSFSFRAGSV